MAELDGVQVPVNEYFLDHPDAVLGELRAVHGAYNAEDLVVAASGDTAAALARALARVAADATSRGLTWTAAPEQAGPPAAPAGPRSRQPDGYLEAHRDGTFTQVADGHAVPFPVPASQGAELRQLLGLRDAVTGLLDAEAASLDDTPELDGLRRDLNRRYDAYAAGLRAGQPVLLAAHRPHRPRHGRGEARPHPPAAGRLPLRPVRAAGPGAGGIRPGQPDRRQGRDLHRPGRRPAQPPAGRRQPRPTRWRSAWTSAARSSCAAIARLLGTSEEQARQDLGTLVFDDPESGRLVPAAEYLSGRVRDKLEAAERAAADDPRYAVNAAELRKVIPADLMPGEIDARLGAAWIDASYVRDFLARDPRRRHRAGRASRRPGLDRPRQPAHRPGHLHLGHRPLPGPAARPGGPGTAPHRGPRQDRRRRLGPEHGGHPRRAGKGRRASRAVRRMGLGRTPPGPRSWPTTYNRLFNDIVLRSYDDAQLSLPGLAMSFEPRPHQVAAVARIINEPAVGLFHEVGAGKTAEMIMGAMELRRLHLARKPAIIVPNHMLEQFSREFLQLYPQAKILVTQREDLQADRRRQFVARCATGDWDAVIMSRSAFERIPMSAEAQRAYLDAELDRMRDFIQASKEGDGLTVKRLEGALLRAEERLKAKLDSVKDPGITFEATGIDYLFVDEAHGYKNLRTPSNIPDAAIDGSMRAADLDMKISYLRAPQRHPGRHLRHRHPDRQQHHRSLRHAALPAPRPAGGRRRSPTSTAGPPPSARPSPRSRWPPKAATASGRRPGSPSSPTCRKCSAAGTSPPTSRPAKTSSSPSPPWPAGPPTASAPPKPSSPSPPTRSSTS